MPAYRLPCETFIGEAITPRPGTFDTSAMARGGPGVPLVFSWRGREYQVARILKTWRTQERGLWDKEYLYVRKHYFRIRTTTGEVMVLRFDRKPTRGAGPTKGRWVLFSIVETGTNESRVSG